MESPRRLAVRPSRFVPERPDELAQALEQAFFPEARDARAFRDVVRLVDDLERHRLSVQGSLLGRLYAPFDPTDDVSRPAVSDPAAGEGGDRFFERLRGLLDRANFDLVSLEELRTLDKQQALPKELEIDSGLDHVERLVVAVRGTGRKAIVIRPWHTLFRRVEVATPTHQRVLVALRMRGESAVQLRLYRDVAHADLDLLLPTVRVRMRFLDKLKLSTSGGASAIAAVRMIKLAILYATKFSVLQVLFLPLIALVGGIYGGKTFFDYTKIRASYLTELARHLFELSIASDRAALARLADMAAEEETKEVLIAYAVLAAAGPSGRIPAELDDGVRSWLRARLGDQVWFETSDALSKLDELALVLPRVEGSRARIAIPPAEACRVLDKTWDELYTAPG